MRKYDTLRYYLPKLYEPRITKKTKRRQQASRLQVYKVQLPLVTSEPVPLALVYNRTRSVEFQTPVTEKILFLMNGEFKLFFYGRIKGTVVDLVKPAPWQEW